MNTADFTFNCPGKSTVKESIRLFAEWKYTFDAAADVLAILKFPETIWRVPVSVEGLSEAAPTSSSEFAPTFNVVEAGNDNPPPLSEPTTMRTGLPEDVIVTEEFGPAEIL
jgi:hypothetical protein